jgi:hypothetical protein
MIVGSIELNHGFRCLAERSWQAITDLDELSAWLGGACSVEPRVGGRIRSMWKAKLFTHRERSVWLRHRGCWLPAAQSARQRAAATAAGLECVDDRYITDVARELRI